MKRLFLTALMILTITSSAVAASNPPNFQIALRQVLLVEGGYVNDPRDTGGETYKGVSRKNFPRWTGWASIDTVKRTVPAQPKFGTSSYYEWVRELNRRLKAEPNVAAAVESFYRGYWNALHMGECRLDTMAYFWADTLTNNGPVANLWLKKAINRTAHKQVVNEKSTLVTSYTIQQLNKLPQDRVLFWFAVARGAKYDRIADKYSQYTDSWADRFIAQVVAAVLAGEKYGPN